MSNVMAIDMGGTKTAIAIFDVGGRLLARSVEATEPLTPHDAVNRFAERARQLEGNAEVKAVGMAMPAIVDANGDVAWAAQSVSGWGGAPVGALLAAAFGIPAVALFDGYAATLGEATFGAGRGYDSLATLIVGTGFGAGVWLEGKVVEGRTGVAGAVGWNRWPLADGVLSEPAEAVASGTGILAAARLAGRHEDYPDTASVFQRASEGDPAARHAVDQAALVAGTVAGHIIDLLAPQLVVWSGGVGSRADFSELAIAVAQQSCQPYAVTRTKFTTSGLGAESSLVGAAAKALSIAKGEDPG